MLYTRRGDRLAGAPSLQTAGIRCCARHASSAGRQSSGATGFSGRRALRYGGNIGRGSRLAFPNDPFYFDFSYRELQENYDPAVGFLQRRGMAYNPEVGYMAVRRHPWLQSLQVEIDWDVLYDMDNRRVGETKQLKPLTVVFADGSEFVYEVHPTYERLERDFEISDGVTLPAGASYTPPATRSGVRCPTATRYPSGRK